MSDEQHTGRRIGLLGATGIGIGAIVGGGILALAGAAFATAGPSAILAFALNGLLALVTALSFAEMSTTFPESGGTYTFARKVLSIQGAFAVGWIVWFASIVAGVLYALGFGTYAALVLDRLAVASLGSGLPQSALEPVARVLALGSTVLYTVSLTRQSTGGGQMATAGKVVAFAVLIAGGLWAMSRQSGAELGVRLSPFFAGGATGLFQAMGTTFIALQGFDLIAAVAGEVRAPQRNLPRAMFLSIGVALAIYLPLLLAITTVGVEPDVEIQAAAQASPETLVVAAAERFLGRWGYDLVLLAAVLSMISALHANLLGASRVAVAMARDRTLPKLLGRLDARRGPPGAAIAASALPMAAILLAIPDVTAAGAASSLIFLISFALVHGMSYLARRRSGGRAAPFRVPLFPLVPVAGALCCAALALFQALSVPSAGIVAGVWLGLGSLLYVALFARRARVFDASAEALDPELMRLRGRSPLVLAPIARPGSAEAMVPVASALAPPELGRVLLLSVVAPPLQWRPGDAPQQLVDAQAVLRETLTVSLAAGLTPEALVTIAPDPWPEIGRIARTHRCESLVLGFTKLGERVLGGPLEELMSSVDCDVVVLRAPERWRLADVQRVLVPVGGKGDHDELRARLLSNLCRTGARSIRYLQVLPEAASEAECSRAQAELQHLAQDEVPGAFAVEVVRSASVPAVLVRQAADSDLLVLGLQRLGRRRKAFGSLALDVVQRMPGAVLMISRRG